MKNRLLLKFREILNCLLHRIDGMRTPTVVVFLCILFLIASSGYAFKYMGGDVAEYINGGYRVYSGELPYVDFWCLHLPGEVYFPAMLFKILGLNINAMLLASTILNVFVGLLFYFIAKQMTRSHAWASLFAVFSCFNGLPFHRRFTYINACFLLLLIFAYLIIRFEHRRGRPYHAFGLGLLIGGACFFRVYEVVPTVGAFLIMKLYFPRAHRSRMSSRVQELLLFIFGIAGMLILQGILTPSYRNSMIHQVLFESLSHGTAIYRPYFQDVQSRVIQVVEWFKAAGQSGGWFAFLKEFYYRLYPVLKTVYTPFFYILPFVVTFATSWMLKKRRFMEREDRIVVFFLSWGLLAMIRPLIKSGFWQLSYANTLFSMLLILILWKIGCIPSRSRFVFDSVFRRVLTVLTVCMLVVSFGILGFQTSHLVLQRNAVKTPNGIIHYSSSKEAIDVQSVVRFIEDNSSKDEYIFVSPWFAPPLYALMNRRNPTYYDSLIDLDRLPSEEKMKRLCMDIEEKGTRIIIHSEDIGLDALQASDIYRIFIGFVETNYTLSAEHGRYLLFTIDGNDCTAL